MDTRKDTSKKATTEPKQNKDESVELQVEELEERIAPASLNIKPGANR